MPFDDFKHPVESAWIDYNGHMNVGYYGVVFDLATDAFLDFVGLDTRFREEQKVTTYCLEEHFTYQREVMDGEMLSFTTQLLAYDAKRIHYFHRMYREGEGSLCATNEVMSVHVSQESRRSALILPEIMQTLQAILAVHARLPVPEQAGRVMGLRARSSSSK